MDVDETIRKIEGIEIQGATAIAEAGVQLLKALYADDAHDERIDEVVARLRAARPTEPLLFNAIRAARASGDVDAVLSHIREGQDAIAAHGQEYIPDDGVIYTHCHSSTVTGTLKRAWAEKECSVRVTETRPLYQGRTTATELADAGIPVDLYVDSGARLALREADVMCIGADAITAEGAVVNKIGSELFASVAASMDVPVYVFADAWKYDPRSVHATADLERREGDEVWADAPSTVNVVNYAFEQVAPDLIDGIVTEQGVVSPENLPGMVADTYPALVPES